MGKQVFRQIYPTDNGACMLYVLEGGGGGGGPGPLGPILDPPLGISLIVDLCIYNNNNSNEVCLPTTSL